MACSFVQMTEEQGRLALMVGHPYIARMSQPQGLCEVYYNRQSPPKLWRWRWQFGWGTPICYGPYVVLRGGLWTTEFQDWFVKSELAFASSVQDRRSV